MGKKYNLTNKHSKNMVGETIEIVSGNFTKKVRVTKDYTKSITGECGNVISERILETEDLKG